jgi:agmatine deiminase
MATPDELGYRMPAEWEPHRGTWLTWPRPEGISFPEKFETVLPVFSKIVGHLVQVEEVHINVWDAAKEAEVRDLLGKAQIPMERLKFHHFPAYEPWCRDHGPTFLVRESHGKRERAIVDWEYNAWGGKYAAFDLDNLVPQHVARFRNLQLFSPGIVLEGGSVDVNGRGTLITTESCLLNPNRNPHLSQKEIAKYLRDFLGVRNVLWLNEGLVGDDTDGHVDDLARFVNPTTVMIPIEENLDDANYQLLQDNLLRLRMARDQEGRLLRIVKLPMPGFVEQQGQRLPASYANFYIANEVVLVPTFGRANDSVALDILQKEFPKRRVIGIDCTELIWGLGSIHCLTQQEPA